MKKILSHAIVLLLAVAIIFSFGGCDLLSAFLEREESNEKIITSNYDSQNVDDSLYEILQEGIEEKKKKIVINYDCSNEIFDTYAALLHEHPEYFWLTKNSKISTTSKFGKTTVTFIPEYFMSVSEIEAAQKALDEKTDALILEASSNPDDYMKVLYVHDYIINNCVYDTAAAEENDGSGKKLSDNVYKSAGVYGCLVEGEALCSGYAASFQYIMDKLDIESGRISGNVKEGSALYSAVGHEWNYVEVNGEFYYIDLTWDDPINSDGGQTLSHNYFLLSEDELTLTHTFDQESQKPECISSTYNYYVYNNLYVEVYDYNAVYAIINQTFHSGTSEIKFSSPEDANRALRELFDNEKIWRIPSVKRSKVKTLYHMVSESGLIITITDTE